MVFGFFMVAEPCSSRRAGLPTRRLAVCVVVFGVIHYWPSIDSTKNIFTSWSGFSAINP